MEVVLKRGQKWDQVNKKVDSTKYKNRSIFALQLVDLYAYWIEEALRIESEGGDASKEKEYAESFQIVLHAYTKVE